MKRDLVFVMILLCSALAASPQNLPGPVARNVAISGTAASGETLASSYMYYSAGGAAESGTTRQWYRAADNSGTTDVKISGATGATYTLANEDITYYIRVGITPGAAKGLSPGATAYSAYVGKVAGFSCPTNAVTFTYNGASVTYGTIASPTTGVCYLDRNLGALRAATSSTDHQGYGDLFQWGRLADGHQLVAWSSDTTGTPVNGTTATLSSGDIPGNRLFITNSNSPNDWRSTRNDNLWQGANGINNPCPSGWYLPTQSDWMKETAITDAGTAYRLLKLPVAGYRVNSTGLVRTSGSNGYYWCSTVNGFAANVFVFTSSTFYPPGFEPRGTGASLRCRR